MDEGDWPARKTSQAKASLTPLSRALQDAYAKLDAILPLPSQLAPTPTTSTSQMISTTSPDAPKSAPVEDFKLSVDQLCAGQKDIQRRRKEMRQMRAEVQRRREQQQQELLDWQLREEQIGFKLDAELKGRQVLESKVEQTCFVAAALIQHCDSLQLTISQISAANNEFTIERNRLMETFSNISETSERILQNEIQEIRDLQQAIVNEKNSFEETASSFHGEEEQLRNNHQKEMSNLNKQVSEMQEINDGLELQQASMNITLEDMLIKEQKASEQHDKEIHALTSQLNDYEEKCTASLSKLNLMKGEINSLSNQSIILDSELKTLNESLLKITEDKMQTENLKEIVTLKISEADTLRKDATENLQKLCSVNIGLQTQLTELRDKLKLAKCESAQSISELEGKLENSKTKSAHRCAHITQELNQTLKQCDAKSDECADLRNNLSTIKLKLDEMKEAKDNALSLHDSLVGQLSERETEKQRLSCELQKTSDDVNAEKQKILEIESLLTQEESLAEKKQMEIANELKVIKEDIKSTYAALESKKAGNILLAQNLQQIQDDITAGEESINDKYCLIITECQNNISQLTKLKELTTQQNQTSVVDWEAEIEVNKCKILEIEAQMLEARRNYEAILIVLETKKTASQKIQQEIDEKETIIIDLTDKSIVSDKGLHIQETKMKTLSASLKEMEERRLIRSQKLVQLEQQIESMEKCKADATLASCEEMNGILCKAWKSKQACESLLSSTSQLNNELDDLRKSHTLLLKEFEATQNSHEEWSKQTENWNQKCSLLNMKSKEIAEACEKLQSGIKHSKLQAVSSNNVYQKMCKDIATAKSKKLRRHEMKSKQKQSPVPMDNEPKATIVSVEATDKQTTPQVDGKQTTPRSILKSPKTETPQSERSRKRVSFVDEDIESSSSTIVLAPEDMDEIEKNPAVLQSIIEKKRARSK